MVTIYYENEYGNGHEIKFFDSEKAQAFLREIYNINNIIEPIFFNVQYITKNP